MAARHGRYDIQVDATAPLFLYSDPVFGRGPEAPARQADMAMQVPMRRFGMWRGCSPWAGDDGLDVTTRPIGIASPRGSYEPFHVARTFMTLDQLTGGRAAWNVVTSLKVSEAANLGRSEVLEHDRHYDRAEEVLAVIQGHWRACDEDAIVVDKSSGLFRTDHAGPTFPDKLGITRPEVHA